MRKYLLISHQYHQLKRGAFTTSVRLQKQYPDYLDHKLDIHSQDIEQLNEIYKKLIFTSQVKSVYYLDVSFLKLRKLNYLFYLREDENPFLYNSCSNGFHYFRRNNKIKYFAPFVTDFFVEPVKKEKPCIGFYIRKHVTYDSYLFITEFLKNSFYNFDIYVMGDNSAHFANFNCVDNYYHTYDNKEFFQNITHYYYPCSATFTDPFPNSVLEAIQNNKQIIFPMLPNRRHVDGIDDLKDCIKWHSDYNPDKELDNSDNILLSKNFDKFYFELFNNDFLYDFDREKYKRFDKWIEHEVL